MKLNSQSRKYILTINNPDEHLLNHEKIKKIMEEKLTVTYYYMCDEIGSETGTYHIHIFLYSTSPIRFSTIKNAFPTAHIDKCCGSVRDNRDYIRKEGRWANTEKASTNLKDTYEEWGTLPTERDEKHNDLSQIMTLIDSGADVNEIIEKYPNYALRRKDIEILKNVRRNKSVQNFRDITVEYIYGDTGTGKESVKLFL